jgi:hypothetical protein
MDIGSQGGGFGLLNFIVFTIHCIHGSSLLGLSLNEFIAPVLNKRGSYIELER